MNRLNKRFPVYSRLIGFYPAEYRRKYEQELLQTTADMLDGADGSIERATIWAKLTVDIPLSIGRQHVTNMGVIMKNDMPNYVKVNGILCGLMLLPFLFALFANGLDKVINNHTLYGSWLWRYDTLKWWVLILPETAAGLAFASLVYFVIRSRQFDIRKNWPLVISGLFACFILFVLRYHDSVGCWVQMHASFLSLHHHTAACQQN